MSIPNLISLCRILMTPVFAALYLRGSLGWAMGVLLLCAVSDVLDGFIARRFHMTTELGKALDPVADKLIQGAMMLCATQRFSLVWLLLAVLVLRETSLGLMSLKVLRVTGRVYGARWYGKLCTAAIYPVLFLALALPEPPRALINAGLLLCTGLAAACLVLYMQGYLRTLRLFHGEKTSPSLFEGGDEVDRNFSP